VTFPPSFAKSWKTTTVSLVSGLLVIIQGFKTPDLAVLIHDPAFQMKVLVLVLGLVSKDANVTGGTSGQPSTEKALIEANVAPSEVLPPKPVDSKP